MILMKPLQCSYSSAFARVRVRGMTLPRGAYQVRESTRCCRGVFSEVGGAGTHVGGRCCHSVARRGILL